MYEVLVIAIGVALGVGLRGVQPPPRAIAWIVGLGATAGALVTIVSGEIEISPGFLLFDASQGAVAGVLAYVVARTAIAARR